MSDKTTMRDVKTRVEDLKKEIEKYQEKRGWNETNPKDMVLSLVLEAAELLEHFQFKSSEEVVKEARLRGPICDELADVLWWVLAMGNRLEIDVARAFEVKLRKNEEKYPAEAFDKDKTPEERRRIYYRIKAKYRGGHPLAESFEEKEQG